MGTDRIDIEFAKKNNKWILFQCRPLPGHYVKENIDIQINKSLVNIVKKINKLKKKILLFKEIPHILATWLIGTLLR